MTNPTRPSAVEPLRRSQHVPHFTGTLAMIWFLAGLFMLFGAGMLGYLAVRLNQRENVAVGSLHLPHLLWLSTALVLVASATVQAAVAAIRRERQDRLRAWLLTTLIVGLLFCVIQVPALGSLLALHLDATRTFEAAAEAAQLGGVSVYDMKVRPQPFFGLIFVFIVVHALHVLGGIVQLIVVTRNAFRGRYDHEYYHPVKHTAMYWHFLDVVWIVMFSTMVALG